MNNQNKRSRGFAFTINNPTKSKEDLGGILFRSAEYIVLGSEKCPTTGTPHYQGFVYYKNPRTFNATRKFIQSVHPGAHIEPMLSTAAANIDYCKKEGDFFEQGNEPKQGERMDLNAVRDRIMSGEVTVDQLTLEDPMLYHKYGRTLHRLEDLRRRKEFRTTMTRGIWIWGPTGVGKSHLVFINYDPDNDYVVPNDGGWWDGYTGQRRVIFNDFRGEIPLNQLLQLVDKWPMTVKRRNREPIPFTSEEVVITSSMHPKLVYKNAVGKGDSLNQLLRRFDITYMDTKTDTEVVGGNTNTPTTSEGSVTDILTEMLRHDDSLQ